MQCAHHWSQRLNIRQCHAGLWESRLSFWVGCVEVAVGVAVEPAVLVDDRVWTISVGWPGSEESDGAGGLMSSAMIVVILG